MRSAGVGAVEVAGSSDEEVERRLWDCGGIQIAAGDHYSAAVARGLDRSSVSRASFAHYNSIEDAAAFLDAVSRCADRP